MEVEWVGTITGSHNSLKSDRLAAKIDGHHRIRNQQSDADVESNRSNKKLEFERAKKVPP